MATVFATFIQIITRWWFGRELHGAKQMLRLVVPKNVSVSFLVMKMFVALAINAAMCVIGASLTSHPFLRGLFLVSAIVAIYASWKEYVLIRDLENIGPAVIED